MKVAGMTVVGINHAQVTVPPGSADAVRAFYGGLLGLPELPVPAVMANFGLIWFRVGDRAELHVGTEAGVDRRATRAHVAYEVTDIAGWRRTLAAAGIELFDQPTLAGFDRFHLHDPFGNRVELIGRL